MKMKIIDQGLVGRKARCQICQCVFVLEKADTWKEWRDKRPDLFSPNKTFSVSCPQCRQSVVIVEVVRVPNIDHGVDTRIENPNLVPLAA